MFKQKYVLEVKGAEDRIHRFECEPKAPLGEIYDALFTMKSIVLKQINDQNEQEVEKNKCSDECSKEGKETNEE